MTTTLDQSLIDRLAYILGTALRNAETDSDYREIVNAAHELRSRVEQTRASAKGAQVAEWPPRPATAACGAEHEAADV